jgi:hypothetical protein
MTPTAHRTQAVSAVEAASEPHTWVCDSPGGLVGIFEPGVQIAYYRRAADPSIEAYLDRAATGIRVGISQTIAAGAIPEISILPDQAGRAALLQDIHWISGLYTDLLGCPAAALRLEVLTRPMCPRFHVDRTGIRLVCTWRGAGTQWLDDAWARRDRLGAGSGGQPDESSGLMLPGAEIGQVPSFAIALLKGSLWQGNERRGLIHRSPTVRSAQLPRVMMSLDAIWEG